MVLVNTNTFIVVEDKHNLLFVGESRVLGIAPMHGRKDRAGRTEADTQAAELST